MDMPAVSVVIPTYNYGRFVREAVESALAQTFQSREVLVIDDGSTDDTPEVLEPCRDRIRYVRQENKGLSAARNTGIGLARGRYVALLDSDDAWHPEKLEAQVARFEAEPDLALVSCGSSLVDVEGTPLDTPAGTRLVGETDRRRMFRRLLLGNCVSGGSNAVIRKTCLDEVGGFDESLRSAEDWDMWLRIARRYRIGFVDRPLTVVRVNPHSMSAEANVARMLDNELRVLAKHCSDASGRVGFYDRRMAFSQRHGYAACAYLAIGDVGRARHHLAASLRANPLHFARQRDFLAALARVLAGERLFARFRRARARGARP